MEWFRRTQAPVVKCEFCHTKIRRSTAHKAGYALVCDEECAAEYNMSMAW